MSHAQIAKLAGPDGGDGHPRPSDPIPLSCSLTTPCPSRPAATPFARQLRPGAPPGWRSCRDPPAQDPPQRQSTDHRRVPISSRRAKRSSPSLQLHEPRLQLGLLSSGRGKKLSVLFCPRPCGEAFSHPLCERQGKARYQFRLRRVRRQRHTRRRVDAAFAGRRSDGGQ